ncbi:long-chain fatty acid--CoA ligase [Mycolicibacterium elephantis]|uniref:long-chain-fatty-acid--CoA ligase n=1 Tax=Mycolicibacterium elephantis TaxID=81858 RepID=UPI0007EB0EC1|nr:long-chain-fatty-acid--CoA ligase [Mycolicibacterium elephantis]OBA76854.1 long-chain fatty acid--CoA ligase [Mycolicibacterium elephantis]
MPYPEITTIADLARAHGAGRPDAVALICGERTITFAELDARSSQAAQAFRAAGVGRGDRVAFVEKNGAEFFEVLCGLAKLGAIAVPVNWRLTAQEMAHIIADAGARAVVVGEEFFGHLDAIVDELPDVHTVVAIGEHGRWPAFDDWLSPHPAKDPGATTGSDDAAVMMYTSGTTGAPKGVVLSNANFVAKTVGCAETWQFSADAVSLAVMPLFHMAGTGWALVGLYVGCPTVVLRDVDPHAILAAITGHRVTNMLLVPAVIQRLLATPGVDSADLSSLRVIVYGASPVADDVVVKALERFRCDLIQVYGMTETTGSVTQLNHRVAEPLRSCGKPYPWVELRVVDPDGHDAAPGAVGEVWTRSAQNMLGYWNNPEATAATVTPDGWLKTGDVGYLDDAGYLYLYDRIKDMIVSGGENVYPAEVENVLMDHPQVADVAVIGVPDDTWGEAVKAIVVPASEAALNPAELLGFARERLAGFKLPKSVDFAAELPRNPSGKLLKRRLREPYWCDVDRRVQ